MTYHSRMLSCPVVRPANSEDAEDIAGLVINSNSKFIQSVFNGDIYNGYHVLVEQFQQYIEGVYVLTEAEQIVGVMKLHLPNHLIGNTLSYAQLVKYLGYRKGIRAGILLSHWDEYEPGPEEAYLEYLYVDEDWEEFNVASVLIEKAYEQAAIAGASYITHFIPTTDYIARERYIDEGFVFRKKIHSILAKLFGAAHSSWFRATYNLTNAPITMREMVVDKIDTMRDLWQQKRREIFAAARLTVALTLIPVVAGSLAYIRGYPIAAIGWALIATAHLLGIKLYLSGSMVGRYGLIIALVAESVNLVGRSITTNNWFDRSWLLPLSLLTFWIASVLIRNPSVEIDQQLTTA